MPYIVCILTLPCEHDKLHAQLSSVLKSVITMEP